MDLLGSVMGNFSDDIVASVAKQAGVDPQMAASVLEKMAPAMTGAMAKNSQSESGARELDKALERNNGDILDKPESVSQDMGSKILGHVFGANKDSLAQEVSSQVGTDSGTAAKVMEMFAPMVLGSFGKEKTKQGIDVNDLSGILGGAVKNMDSNSGMMALAMKYADLDGDGSVIDDVPKLLGFMAMAKKFLGMGK